MSSSGETASLRQASLTPLLIGLLLLGVAASAIGTAHFDSDDGFIVYRIAENLSAGKGWVYNPGERVNSSTSVLWTLLLALGSSVAGSALVWAHIFTALFLTAACVLLYRLLAPHAGPLPATFAGLLLAVDPLLFQTVGLETDMMLALALAFVSLHLSGKDAVKGLVGGLLVLSRPDTVLLLGIAWLDDLLRRKALPWVSILWAGLVVLPWFVFSFFYFGDLLPNTLSAKTAQAASGLWQLEMPGIPGALPLFVKGLLWWFSQIYAAWMIGLGAIMVLGGLMLLRWNRACLLLVGWGSVHLLAYTILRVPHYHWYYAPTILAGIVLAALGLSFFVRSTRVMLKSAGILVALIVLGHQFYLLNWFRQTEPSARIRAYREVAEWIPVNQPRGSVIAAAEIGVIGYFTKAPIVDMAGILHRQGPEYLRRKEFGWWLELEPDLVVTHQPVWELEKGVLDEAGQRRYEVLKEFEFEDYGSLKLWGRRKPQPPQ